MKFFLAALVVALPLSIAPAMAAVVDTDSITIDSFGWEDLGQIDRINGVPDTSWTVTVDVDSTITFFVKTPLFGTTFGFLLDGVATDWTFETTFGRFAKVDVFLAAGVEYLFSVEILTDNPFRPNFTAAAFSPATPVAPVAPVPLPAGGVLLLAGLGALTALRRKAA